MSSTPEVQILMATYNGEKFLPEQLDSMLAQTYPNWRLLVRDDGSKDNTTDILAAYKAKHPSRIDIINDGDGNLGYTRNFERLAKASTAPIVSFADQDDIWRETKVARSVETLLDMQSKFGQDMPLLAHHDFTHVDANKKLLCASFDAAHGYRKSHPAVSRMPFGADVHGFSMSVNRQLLDAALPLPQVTNVHDSVIGCLAADIGKIGFIPEQLADYRQHGNNSSQAVSFARRTLRSLLNGSVTDLPSNLCKVFDAAKENLSHKKDCAASYLATYGQKLPEHQQKALIDFIHLDELSFAEKAANLSRQSGMSWKSKLVAALVL